MTVAALRPAFATYGDMLAAQARAQGERIATIFGGRQRSYRTFDERSTRIGNALRARGMRRGSRVAILARNSDTYLELLHGIARSGASAVVLNWRLSPFELAGIARLAEPGLLFWDAEFAAGAGQIEAAVPGMLSLPIGTPGVETPDYERFVAAGFATAVDAGVCSDDVLLLMFTSGTTGMPKGVPTTHAAMIHRSTVMVATEAAGESSPDDIHLLTTPLFHLAGLGLVTRWMLNGATLVIVADSQMPTLVDAIERYRVTHASFVPALMPELLAAVAAGRDLSSLRIIGYGASPIPQSLLERMVAVIGCGFRQNYGMSEVSGGVTRLDPADHYPGSKRLASCGRAYPDTELRIVDDAGRDCNAGETGEIVIRSPSLFAGYWRRPAETAAAFVDGWYRSGDMGYLDEDGYLFLRDRKKDMIVSGGENIFPAEIEAAIAAHPGVVRAAVIGVPSARWGEEARAFVIGKAQAELDAAALAAFLRERLAGYKIPKSFEFVASLPLSPLGKVMKQALREPYWAHLQRAIN